ncbi:unnamed protein product [Rotaria magnacalcarata]|uniref:Uncharacterized protein n=2 Tax=Rotaria magnacalcarata TaxID=392030 RepID=A0A816YUP0_9BILA|nr:unnamed protein product [Rotaria magnacalcarata]CAF4174723.1 unnamed protein product [Rotaria magnacalcarata]
MRTCLNLYSNEINQRQNRSSESLFNFVRCSSVDTAIHSSSRELFIREQEAVSFWLDLQYDSSINRRSFDKSIIARRLVSFEIAKNSSVCSQKFQNWILNYQQWHENISFLISNRSITVEKQLERIVELDIRFLIYEKPSSGIADRIVHFITTFLIAILTNRLFIFDKDWPLFIDYMQSSLNYQSEFVIPWFSQLNFTKNLPLNIENKLTTKKYSFSFDRHTKDYNYDKNFPERILIFNGHTGSVIHIIKSNSSIYRKLLTIDLEMNRENIFGCLYSSLFTYRLSAFIESFSLNLPNDQLGHSSQQILQTLLSPRFFPIGIQIRVSDETMIRTDRVSDEKMIINRFHSFFQCSQDLISKNERVLRKTNQLPIIFLLSDDLRVRQAALKHSQLSLEQLQSSENYSPWNTSRLNILANANPVLHISHTNNQKLAFQLGIIDSFLFSLCEQHIISSKSGYGRFSVFASLKQRNIYTLVPGKQYFCHNQSVSLAAAAYEWSGI